MRLFIVILLLALAGTPPSIASERIESPHFVFVYQDGKQAMATELARRSETVLKQVCATLGNKANEVGQINVAIYHGADAFNQALTQWGARVEWAAGIAIPSQNQILLRIDAQTRFNIHDIFRHEVSHVALHNAVGGQRIPRWFNEGIAVHQAGERILERWQRTAEASLSDGLIPFETLKTGFPANGLRADLAYAQSTAFVSYLIKLHSWQAIRVLLKHVRDGAEFDLSVARVFGRSLADLEQEWRLEVDRRASWIPFLTGTGILWIIISALFVLSWAVNRHRTRRRLQAMDEPELDDEYA